MLIQFNVRLSSREIATVKLLARELGCSDADVIRQAVRLLARREGISPEKLADFEKKNNSGKSAKSA